MRITQSMLSRNMLNNLTSSYSKLGKYQEQLMTGKKINRPSDDPIVAMKGVSYRTNLEQVKQFQRNIGEVNNWLNSSDEALEQVNNALHRVSELLVQASSDTVTPGDREKIASEIDQIQKQVVDIANTKVGDKYLFSGTNTTQPLYNGMTENPATNSDKVEIEVFNGITLDVNADGKSLFGGPNGLVAKLSQVLNAMNNPANSGDDIDGFITEIDAQKDSLLNMRGEIGAKQNRVEMMEARLSSQEIITTKQLSDNEDADIEKVITNLKMQESVHRAILGAGSRIIQPTLMDFLR